MGTQLRILISSQLKFSAQILLYMARYSYSKSAKEKDTATTRYVKSEVPIILAKHVQTKASRVLSFPI